MLPFSSSGIADACKFRYISIKIKQCRWNKQINVFFHEAIEHEPNSSTLTFYSDDHLQQQYNFIQYNNILYNTNDFLELKHKCFLYNLSDKT